MYVCKEKEEKNMVTAEAKVDQIADENVPQYVLDGLKQGFKEVELMKRGLLPKKTARELLQELEENDD